MFIQLDHSVAPATMMDLVVPDSCEKFLDCKCLQTRAEMANGMVTLPFTFRAGKRRPRPCQANQSEGFRSTTGVRVSLSTGGGGANEDFA